MPKRFLERQSNIFYRLLSFIALSNIFISICAASATAYTLLVFGDLDKYQTIFITLGTTFILYNTQHLLLRYLGLKNLQQRKDWYKKHKIVLWLMIIAGLAEIYPLLKSSWSFLATYCLAGVISLLYFLPFSNLRSIPFLKSFIIGLVWTLISVVAPLGLNDISNAKINFAIGQLLFITALCVLFNIRDVQQDITSNTYTIPVLYGVNVAKIFTFVLLGGFLLACYFTDEGGKFMLVSTITFLGSCGFTLAASPQRHNFYYLLGVDGLILLQSILGFVFLK
jgi:hypothetical protein